MKFKKLYLILLLFFSSCLKQGSIVKVPGVEGPLINLQDGKIILSLGLEELEVQSGATIPIPKLKNSNLTLAPKLEGGSIFQINFDPKDIENEEFKIVPQSTLPDGRAFPFMIGGTLPAIAINIPKAFNSTFYASNNVFGVALPFSIPRDFNSSIHYRLKINDKNIGLVSLIGPENEDQEAYFVILLTLENIRNNPDFRNLLKFSKKFPKDLF